MNESILKRLRTITAEEQAILDGRTTIDRELYMEGRENTINAQKLLSAASSLPCAPTPASSIFPSTPMTMWK